MKKLINGCIRLSAFAFCLVTLASDPPTGLQLTTKGPHPLAETVWAIQSRCNWLLNYEEGPVLALDELIPRTAPTGRPMLVRRTQPISTTLSSEDMTSATPQRQLAVVNALLENYGKSGASDSFRAVPYGRYINILPVSVRGENGQTQTFDPILGTKISFPETHFSTVYGLVQEVIAGVSARRGVPIVLGGMFPSNLFRGSVVESAQNEPARDVLARAFWSMNGPRLAQGVDAVGVTWTLLYDPNSRQYWLNASALTVRNVN
jgi:hypothetical protein